MANTTYYNTVNRVLRRHGQNPIADTTTFDSGTLDKTQLQAKLATDEAHRLICLDMPAQFLIRTGSISTTGSGVGGDPVLGDNTTGWSMSCFAEDVIEDSWFNTTTSKTGELQPKPHDQFVREQPDHTVRTTGRPQYYVLLPNTADGATADYVCFDPPPDDTYTIKFKFYARTPTLSLAADTIELPVRFEPFLWEAAGALLEFGLSEGKYSESQTLLMPTFTKIRSLILGLPAETPRAWNGMRLSGVQKRGRKSAWSPD